MSPVVDLLTHPARGRVLPLVLGVGVLASLGGACDQERRPAGPQNPGLSSQAVYENPEAGIAVALPRTWQGGYRIEAVSGDAATSRQPRAQHVVTFHYVPLTSAAPDMPLLTLSTFAPGDWNAPGTEAPSRVGTVVAESPGRIVVAWLPSVNPFDEGSADAKRFETMRVTPDQVRAALLLR